MSLAEALRALQSDPDDLTTLPQIIEQVESLEGEIGGYQERISRLQQVNKEYLNMIPTTINETEKEDEEPEEQEVTFEDAQQQLLNALQNSGGN